MMSIHVFLIVSVLHFQLAFAQLYSINKGVQLSAPLLEQGSLLPNNSMIHAALFTSQDNDNDGTIDALYCQSANNGSNIGVWYYPNGTQVPIFTGGFNDVKAPHPLFSKRFSGQIALARKGGLAGNEGLYSCVIPDENSLSQTLVVGIYTVATSTSYDGPSVSPSMKFSLITPRFANPPVFRLSFNVSDGFPTNVTCTVGTNPLTIKNTDLSRVIVHRPRVTKVQVTVTVRMRQAGTYQCTVSITRVIQDKISIVTASSSSLSTVSVLDKPSSFTATRLNTGLTHVRLSWSSVSRAVGYEVFQSKGDIITSLANITTHSMDITSGLSLDVTYNFYIISYGNGPTLPSEQSMTSLDLISSSSVNDLTATTITSASVSLTWSHPSFVPQSYSITRGCRRLCDQSVTNNDFNSISSPYESSGIISGSECSFTLRGIYGSDQVNLATISATTLSSAPTSSVSSVTISSVKARSMRVSWGEVPCNGQNGPITGYWLYYTNTTFNDSVNIIGGDMGEYILTSLAPYRSYSVRIRPYNDGGIGPTSNVIIQQTSEDVPGVVSNLMSSNVGVGTISISWDVPSILNGIITFYEIRHTNWSDTYNTINTQYTIEGLIPNTLYKIEVRAYTNAGAGEWTSIDVTTNPMRYIINQLNATAVRVSWQPITSTGDSHHYTVYYMSSDRQNRQSDIMSVTFPSSTREGVIGGLNPNREYTYAISVTVNFNCIVLEGGKTPFIKPGGTVVPSSTNVISGLHVFATSTCSPDIQSAAGPITGISLLSVIVVILLVVVVIETSLLIYLYYKRHTTNITLKSSNKIDMKTRPAHGTTVLTSTGLKN